MCSSEKPIICLEQKLSGSHLCPIYVSLWWRSNDRGEKIFVCPSNEINEYVTV